MSYMIRSEVRGALYRYIKHGIPTGDFLRAVLANDLRDAIGRADAAWTIGELRELMKFLYWEAPASCIGDRKTVDAWIGHGGAEGLRIAHIPEVERGLSLLDPERLS